MKQILFIFLLISTINVYAQDTQVLEQDGVVISYKLMKIESNVKKDIYLLSVKAVNKNNYDIFYQGPKNGVNPFFGEVTVRNTDDYIYLIATESRLSTENGKLFYIKQGGSINAEKEFKIATGVTPIITGKLVNVVKSISEYR